MQLKSFHSSHSGALGFLLLTHDDPAQIYELVSTLNCLFLSPPIVIHHDFSKCSLTLDAFPRNVTIVEPYRSTGWGHFSLVEATLQGLDDLFSRNPSVRWAVFLSGSDYPVKPPGIIWDELDSSEADCFLSHKRVHWTMPRDAWQTEFAKRYLRIQFPLTKRQIPFARIPVADRLIEKVTVFRRNRYCFGGSQWFSIRRTAADYLLKVYRSDRELTDFYSTVPMADESYVHTVLCNNHNLKIVDDHKRFFRWSSDGHTLRLNCQDVPSLRTSTAHFARRVSFQATPDLKEHLSILITAHESVSS